MPANNSASSRPASSPKRQRGAQPANINALKHGRYAADFWTRTLSVADRRIWDLADTIPADDLSGELATFRAALLDMRDAALKDHELLDLLFTGLHKLAGVAATHYRLSGDQEQRLEDGMASILSDLRLVMAHDPLEGM